MANHSFCLAPSCPQNRPNCPRPGWWSRQDPGESWPAWCTRSIHRRPPAPSGFASPLRWPPLDLRAMGRLWACLRRPFWLGKAGEIRSHETWAPQEMKWMAQWVRINDPPLCPCSMLTALTASPRNTVEASKCCSEMKDQRATGDLICSGR